MDKRVLAASHMSGFMITSWQDCGSQAQVITCWDIKSSVSNILVGSIPQLLPGIKSTDGQAGINARLVSRHDERWADMLHDGTKKVLEQY